MKKVAIALLLVSSISAPAYSNELLPADLEIFESHGACQSAIIDVRNGVRKLSTINVSGGTVSLVCKVISGGPNSGKYHIVVG